MVCGITLFSVLLLPDGIPTCYQSNCPKCGGESYKKRVGKTRIQSDSFTIVDAIEMDDLIKLVLE